MADPDNGYFFRNIGHLAHFCKRVKVYILENGEIIPRRPSESYPTRSSGPTASRPIGYIDDGLRINFVKNPDDEIIKYHDRARRIIRDLSDKEPDKEKHEIVDPDDTFQSDYSLD